MRTEVEQMRTFVKSTIFKKHTGAGFIAQCDIELCDWVGVTYTYDVYEPHFSKPVGYLFLCPEHNEEFNPKGYKRIGLAE